MRTPSASSNKARWDTHHSAAVDWRPPPVPTTVVAPHPDGDLAGQEHTIERAIEDVDHRFIAAPWVHDQHCDHEACGRAALDVARRGGATVAAGLFWARHRTDPQQLENRLARLHLDDIRRDLKLAATNAHTSQLVADTPVLTTDDLAPARWHHEYFVTSIPSDPLEATR